MSLENLLENLMVPDTQVIKMAQTKIQDELQRPETLGKFLNMMANHEKSNIRQTAAVLLKNYLSDENRYKLAPFEIRLDIKKFIIDTIFKESEKLVRSSMIQFLAHVFLYENEKSGIWVNESFQKILCKFESPNEHEIDIAAAMLFGVSEIAPEVILERFDVVKHYFESALLAVNSNIAAISPNILYYILETLSTLSSEMENYCAVWNFYQSAFPLILGILNKTANDGIFGNNFTPAIDIISNMAESKNFLLDSYIKGLVEFLLSVGGNTVFSVEKRTESLILLGTIVSARSALLVKLNLIEFIVANTFDIISKEPEKTDSDEFFISSEDETPWDSAIILMDTISKNVMSTCFLEPLLKLVAQAVVDYSDYLKRRAGFAVLGTIVEGSHYIISEHYFDSMLSVLKQGLFDNMQCVRNAALYAISEFAVYMPQEIKEQDKDLLPTLLTYAKELAQAYIDNQMNNHKHVKFVLYALETVFDAMEDALDPYLQVIMQLIFSLFDSAHFPLRKQALELLETLAKNNTSLDLWCKSILQRLHPLLWYKTSLQEVNEAKEFRLCGINALAEVVRNISEDYLPYAEMTIRKSIELIQYTDDIEEKKSLLNLLGALATVVQEEFFKVIDVVLQQIEICLSDEEQTVDENEKNACMNPYVEAKVCAFNVTAELAEACPQALLKTGKTFYEMLVKSTEQCCGITSESNFCALKAFTTVLYRSDPHGQGKTALRQLLGRFIIFVYQNREKVIVCDALSSISDILIETGKDILETTSIKDSIAECVLNGLQLKFACQCCGAETNDNYCLEVERNLNKDIIEKVLNMFVNFGKFIDSEQFAIYFDNMEALLLQHIQNFNTDDSQNLYATLIGFLASYYKSLGRGVCKYFSAHYKLLMCSIMRKNVQILRNAILALGQLFFVADDISYQYYDEILTALSEITATQPKRIVMESVTGALARLILRNFKLVPCVQIVPVIVENLQLIDEDEEVEIVFQCLEFLFENFPTNMEIYLEVIIVKIIQSLANDIYTEAVVKTSSRFIEKLKTLFPDKYQKALNNEAIRMAINQGSQHVESLDC